MPDAFYLAEDKSKLRKFSSSYTMSLHFLRRIADLIDRLIEDGTPKFKNRICWTDRLKIGLKSAFQ